MSEETVTLYGTQRQTLAKALAAFIAAELEKDPTEDRYTHYLFDLYRAIAGEDYPR